MSTQRSTTTQTLSNRIHSVDFFRGITMFLLAGEAARFYSHLRHSGQPVLVAIGDQLEHHEWHGLYFWDLVQPFFMFLAGVSIPFAVANRLQKGDTMRTVTKHAFKRAGILLFLGWALYFIPSGGTMVFKFQNVLAQLSFTYLIAFLIRDKTAVFQIVVSVLLLLAMDIAYRFFPVTGFDHPWTNFENLGAWTNNHIEGVTKSSTWATINFVATTAHTIWGVLCGKVLMRSIPVEKKIKQLLIAAVVCLVTGYTLDLLSITPIIKKIATGSFVLVSGGYTILALALAYYFIDVKKNATGISWFFQVIGANSLFIYLFMGIGATKLLAAIINPFVVLLFGWFGQMGTDLLSSAVVWLAMWGLCYWLYKNKIFFKV